MALDQYQSISININQYQSISTNINQHQGVPRSNQGPGCTLRQIWPSVDFFDGLGSFRIHITWQDMTTIFLHRGWACFNCAKLLDEFLDTIAQFAKHIVMWSILLHPICLICHSYVYLHFQPSKSHPKAITTHGSTAWRAAHLSDPSPPTWRLPQSTEQQRAMGGRMGCRMGCRTSSSIRSNRRFAWWFLQGLSYLVCYICDRINLTWINNICLIHFATIWTTEVIQADANVEVQRISQID
jgi:hypothetical protein